MDSLIVLSIKSWPQIKEKNAQMIQIVSIDHANFPTNAIKIAKVSLDFIQVMKTLVP